MVRSFLLMLVVLVVLVKWGKQSQLLVLRESRNQQSWTLFILNDFLRFLDKRAVDEPHCTDTTFVQLGFPPSQWKTT